MTEQWSPEQGAYQRARAAYDAALAEHRRREAVELPEGLWDTDWDAAYDISERIRTEVGLGQLYPALLEAERVLIAWLETLVKKMPVYAELAEVFASQRVAHRKRLVEIAMRQPGAGLEFYAQTL